MKAIKIDVVKKEIYEIEIKGDYHSLSKELECLGIERVRISRYEFVWVDEEGLLRNPPLGAFKISTYPNALSGHGIVLGANDPDTTSTRLTLNWVKGNVNFVDPSGLAKPEVTVTSFDTIDDFLNHMKGKKH